MSKEYYISEIEDSVIKELKAEQEQTEQTSPETPLISTRQNNLYFQSCNVSTYKTPDYMVIYDDQNSKSKYDSFKDEFMSDLNRYGRTPIENPIFDVSSPDFKSEGIGNGFIVTDRDLNEIFYMKDVDNIYAPVIFYKCSDKYVIASYKKLVLIIGPQYYNITKIKGICKYYKNYLLLFQSETDVNEYNRISLIDIMERKEYVLTEFVNERNIKFIDFALTQINIIESMIIICDAKTKIKIEILIDDIKEKCNSCDLPENDKELLHSLSPRIGCLSGIEPVLEEKKQSTPF